MNIINFLLIAGMYALGGLFYSSLPNMMPMHWNYLGQIDSYMPKHIALWYMPTLTLVMALSFMILPFFDPKKEKYQLFAHEWGIMQMGIIGFMAYVHGMIIYLTLNPSVQMMPLMFIGLGALFILMGNYMSKIRQNYFIGVKTPWTLASEDNWNKTHRYASWSFVLAGIVCLAESYFIWYAHIIILGSILLAAFLPIMYSFLLYKKAAHTMKYIYAGIIVIALLSIGIMGKML